MTHGDAYQFVRLGRSLERADMTTRIIDVASTELGDPGDEAHPYQNVMWVSVLQSLSAYQMYRLSLHNNVRPPDVLEFWCLLGSESDGVLPLTSGPRWFRLMARGREATVLSAKGQDGRVTGVFPLLKSEWSCGYLPVVGRSADLRLHV